MAKLAVGLANLDELPESANAKEMYVKGVDGLYYPDLDNVDAMPAVKGLVSTLKKFKEVEPDATSLPTAPPRASLSDPPVTFILNRSSGRNSRTGAQPRPSAQYDPSPV